MSTPEILLLGAIAGASIFLGLPVGRMQSLSANTRAGLSALATGVLVFLLWDVLSNAVDPMDTALHAHDWGSFAGLAALGALGFCAGLMSLVYYDAWMKRRAGRRSSPLVGPGAAAVDEFASRRWFDLTTPAVRLAFLIAIGIGVHNFAEGLAIGQAAAADEISLAVTLIIGFGLHNATEGFGIVGPLGSVRPSWTWLGVAGLVGGGPTMLGTIVGYQVHSRPLELLFYALAGGAVLYVIGEIWTGMRRYGHRILGLYLIAAGFLVGVGTDLIVAYGGG